MSDLRIYRSRPIVQSAPVYSKNDEWLGSIPVGTLPEQEDTVEIEQVTYKIFREPEQYIVWLKEVADE